MIIIQICETFAADSFRYYNRLSIPAIHEGFLSKNANERHKDITIQAEHNFQSTRVTVDDDSNIILIMSYDILHDPIEDRIEETSCSIPSLLSFLNCARLQFCIEICQLITEKLHRIEIANVNFIAPKLAR